VRPDIVGEEARRKAYTAGLIKDIENRTWATKHRGKFLVHASLGLTRREYDDVGDFLCVCDLAIKLPPFEELQRGGIVGAAKLVDCVDASESHWYMGSGLKGFMLRDARPLPFIPCRGMLNFFDVPDDVAEKVREYSAATA
jgi:hypothetical protein